MQHGPVGGGFSGTSGALSLLTAVAFPRAKTGTDRRTRSERSCSLSDSSFSSTLTTTASGFFGGLPRRFGPFWLREGVEVFAEPEDVAFSVTLRVRDLRLGVLATLDDGVTSLFATCEDGSTEQDDALCRDGVEAEDASLAF